MGIFGGGSPPRNGAESQMPMTPLWQQQVIKAEVSCGCTYTLVQELNWSGMSSE